jgi:hypothetical protein
MKIIAGLFGITCIGLILYLFYDIMSGAPLERIDYFMMMIITGLLTSMLVSASK